jgi:hypothetical protein
MNNQNDSKLLAQASSAAAAPAASEFTVQSGDVYVEGQHYTPGDKLQLTAKQAKRLGDAVKPA